MSGKVIWHTMMSVDGYIAGPEDSVDWGFGHSDEAPSIADEVLEAAGAILGGRRWYDVAAEKYDGREGIYGGRWSGPIYVLTHRPPEEPAIRDIEFVSDGIESAVAAALEGAGGGGVVTFGADISRQVIDAGLLDELVIHVAPVLLGDGIRLYGGAEFERVELERTVLAETGQLTDFRFVVRK